MIRRSLTLAALFAAMALPALAQGTPPATAPQAWTFAVSGDSRNCGDVVMPAIAAGAAAHHASFFWHLGDLRKMSGVDEDIQHTPEFRKRNLSYSEYCARAWDDFIANQAAPFGTMPLYIGIGNHELAGPQTRAEFVAKFSPWLDAPALRAQRLRDDPADKQPRTYFHWVERGVDFIFLDTASKDQLDIDQLKWFRGVLDRDLADAGVKTLVVGTHRPLPDGISESHGMNESAQGTESGRSVYAALLRARGDGRKNVYVLASHSHYFVDGAYETEYWRTHGGVLPGWVIGTAGAIRYKLPAAAKNAHSAATNVYGYLLGTVSTDGSVEFEFKRVTEADVPAFVSERFTPEFVRWCFEKNSDAKGE